MQLLRLALRRLGRHAAPASLVALLGTALLLAGAPSQPARSQTQEQAQPQTQNFQDWTVACLEEEGRRACRMLQNVANDQGQVMMQVAIFALPDGNPGLLINLPLGVWLPEGVVFQIDGGQEIGVPYARCLPPPDQCRVEIVLDQTRLEQLKAGTRIGVTFWDPRQRPVRATVSLLGFTAGFNALRG